MHFLCTQACAILPYYLPLSLQLKLSFSNIHKAGFLSFFYFKVRILGCLSQIFAHIFARNFSSTICISVTWRGGIFPYDIKENVIPVYGQISHADPFLYHLKLWSITLRIPDGDPFFDIGWTSEKLSDGARTRLGPVSQSVNRLKYEFFWAEILRVRQASVVLVVSIRFFLLFGSS